MVKWSVPAKNDLKQIHDYIAKDSKYYAQNVVQEIVTKSEKLTDFPEIGRAVPEISDQNIRELIVYSYRLIYGISETGIEKYYLPVPFFAAYENNCRCFFCFRGHDYGHKSLCLYYGLERTGMLGSSVRL